MDGIRVEGLGKRFGSRVAVSGLTFEVRPGEVFGLLGPNGAGKTTTVRMLAGLLRPTEGSGEVAGWRLPLEGEGGDLRSAVGLLTEQPGLYDRLTARENLEFQLRVFEVDRRRGWTLADAYLDRFELSGRLDEPVGGFSKGMRQKLAIVRTLIHEPRVIFLDEPTSGLDPLSARVVRDVIADLAKQGCCVVLCSHNLAEVERLCARVAVIKNTLRMVSDLSELPGRGASLALRVVGKVDEAVKILENMPVRVTARVDGQLIHAHFTKREQAPDLIARLVHAGIALESAVPGGRALEETYLQLVSE